MPAANGEMIMEVAQLRASTRRTLAELLPETLEEAERLAAQIENAVQRETGRAVSDLTVEVGPHGIKLAGRCETYYTKQMAQHAAMQVSGDQLINDIEVL
jgi:hypothetical protein